MPAADDRLSGLDVVVEVKDVVRVVAELDGGEAPVILLADPFNDPVVPLVSDEVEVNGPGGPGPDIRPEVAPTV